MKRRLSLLLLMLAPAMAGAENPVDSWLDAQTKLEYWQAEVTQVRALKGLARPLRSPGKAWVAQPDRMRWELGQPARTVAVRNGGVLEVRYPKLDQTERYGLEGEINPAGRQALALLEAGFPTDREAFLASYAVEGTQREDDRWLIDLSPKADGAKRLLDAVRLEVDPASWALLATEFRFPDGSKMRNEFSNAVAGQAPDDSLFALTE